MTKFVQILFVAVLAMVALCAAEGPRFRSSQFQAKRNRFLARQEVEAEPAEVTPYPSADDLKPEVPFDEAVAAEELTPNQPDEVYGPPEQEAGPAVTDDIVPLEEEELAAEDEAAAVAEEEAIAEAEAAAEAEEAAAFSRLTSRKALVRPVKLRQAAPAKLRKLTAAHLQLQPQLVQQPLFYYVAQ